MYLVESPEDVLKLEVKNDARLSFMTQTSLVDDTLMRIDALRARFLKSSARVKTTFTVPPLTVRKARALAEQADVVLVGRFEKTSEL